MKKWVSNITYQAKFLWVMTLGVNALINTLFIQNGYVTVEPR